jgi:phage terminase large subunit-like protein
LTETPVDTYAAAIVAGERPAGKYHRLACARHLTDRAREETPGFPYRFSWPHAARFLKFAGCMKHYKGRQFAGQRFEPSPFQVFRLGALFGWRHAESGLRRFTTAYTELPRKQGKSFEAAVVAVYTTFFEGEAGAEGYTIATKEKQARIVFDAAKRLVRASGLTDRIQVRMANLSREATVSKLEALGADSDRTDGLNPHFVAVDELHAFRTRGLLDVMESATGARLNPLIFIITTAGNDLVSVCGDQHDYACKILDGALGDDPSTLSFFACIAHADPGDDPWDPATWQKANPHYGLSVNPEDLAKLAAKAQHMPAAAAEFQQKRLNLWVNASTPCLSMDGWRAGQSHVSREAFAAALEHESCYVGIDLAAKLDLMAVAYLFPPAPGRPAWHALLEVWTPAETLLERAHRDRAPYQTWVDQGWLQTTPGRVLDHDVVRASLVAARARYDLELVLVDPWHAHQLMTALVRDDGFSAAQVVEMPQQYSGRGAGDATLKAEILAGHVDANGDPLTTWCVSNVVEDTDRNGNIFFTKNPRKSRGRIDPVTAMSNAIAGWLRRGDTPTKQYQVYVY